MSDRTRLRAFRPADPVRVVRDNTLNGEPVLLIGWWLNAAGMPEQAHVLTLGSPRATSAIAGFVGENPHYVAQATLALPPTGGLVAQED